MNYLAQGIQQGAQIGAQAYAERKRREQEAALDQARREMQLELDARRTAAEKALQNERLVHDAKMQFGRQKWQSGEGEKERGWRSGERRDSEVFTSGQNDLNRGLTKSENAADRALRQKLQDDQIAQDMVKFGFNSGIEARKLGLLEQEAPGKQKLTEAQATYYKSRSPEDDMPAPTSSKLSAEDQQALAWARANPTDPRAKKILELHRRSP